MIRTEMVSLSANPSCIAVGHIVYRDTKPRRVGKIVGVTPSTDAKRPANAQLEVHWNDGASSQHAAWELYSHEFRVHAHERALAEERYLLAEAQVL